jgi:hypothetical protein
MDKTEELGHVQAVYGEARRFELLSRESPDFGCRRDGRAILGVEVSEIFSDESDARLRKVEGYVEDLLSGGEFLHKDDSKALKVGVTTIIDPNGVVKAEVMGIMQQVPPFPRRVDLLYQLIKQKTRDLEGYAKRWPAVDLIVADQSGLFGFNEYREFFGPFSYFVDREPIARSKFREIYVLTRGKGEPVVIPLRLNLFAEDAFVFEELLFEELKPDEVNESQQTFQAIAHCLSAQGYGAFHAVTVDGSPGIVVGAYLYLYTSEGKVIRDYRTIPDEMPNGIALQKFAKGLHGAALALANRVVRRRPELTGCVPLYFPKAQTGQGG